MAVFCAVHYNSVQYNLHDLETRLFVPERNQLIVDTWLEACQGRRTVIFCVSVQHAREIAALFRAADISAVAVSGDMAPADRQSFQEKFRRKEILILCACDLLNEGWDCPEVEVLFMARPTMSRVLYTQQLGRGMRKAPGKDCLMVFDFVDNAGRFNCPYSLHRLFHIAEYHAGAYVAAPAVCMAADEAVYARGEKPPALLDWPIHAQDYELVDLFNWQEQAEGMISQMEFVRRVNVQPETVEKYLQAGKLKADLEVPLSGGRTFKYFRPETLYDAAEQFSWELIEDSNRKDVFLDMVRRMTMTYSYKPVLLKGMFQHADSCGRVRLSDLVSYFRSFYEGRRAAGLVVEKPDSLYARGDCSDKDICRCILEYPFRRFESMSLMRHAKTLGILQIEETVWYYLTPEEKEEILRICDEKLDAYYKRIAAKSPIPEES